MKIVSGIIVLFLAYSALNAQNFIQRFSGFPVTINSISSTNPFNGGMDSPKFQMADIDGDGDLDLFVYDRDTSLYFYRNDGNNQVPVYNIMSSRYLNLPIRTWFQFVDMDADGDLDLFTGSPTQTIRYFKNTGSPTNPAFTIFVDPVRTNTDTTITSESAVIPVLSDIDCDGDYDLFAGNSIGTVTFYRNIGTPQNFIFQFVTSQFAGIQIIGGGLDNERHGASSITFTDIDADNDPDLFWGDFFGSSIYFIRNTGTCQNFNWNVIDSSYPPPTVWRSVGYNMPRFYDINADGLKDFFIGVIIGAQSRNNFIYYRNNGPASNPTFTKMTENYITCIDAGSSSYPAFTDIDNDGDADLLIGSDHATVSFYRNTGTASAPALTLVADSLAMLHTNFNYAIAFGDIDGDTKKDMILGTFSFQKLRFMKNTGTLVNPVFTLQVSQLDTMNIGQSAAPALVDIDADGDLDLFAGSSGGGIIFFRNNGTPTTPNFVRITNSYMNISVGNDAAPCFADFDNDGDLDLFVGNRNGYLAYYQNTGTPSNANFVLVSSTYGNFKVDLYCVPAVVDINADTDKDIFLGNSKGGIFWYENRDVFGIHPIGNSIPVKSELYQNYPNPFNPSTKIKFDIAGTLAEYTFLSVYDMLGNEVKTLVHENLKPGTYEVDFNAVGISSGIYFYKLITGNHSISRKMVIIK